MDGSDSNPAEIPCTRDTPTNASSEVDGNNSANAGGFELNEDQALALLQRNDVTAADLALLARGASAVKSRKVLLGLATHPRTPRHITMPLLRRLFTFDLMQVALTPAVAADVKRAAEEQILNRLESVSLGERISLARRASGRVAAALLLDAEVRVISTALDNAHLVEALVVTALMKHNAPESLFALTAEHPKWSLRREVQIALLRSEKTPPERALELAGNFSVEFLREIVPESRRGELVQSINSSAVEGSESGESK